MPLHAAALPFPRIPRLARIVPSLALAALAAAAVAHVPPAHAAGRKGSSVSATVVQDGTTVRPRRHRVARPKVQRTSSDESTAERDRRLARECRGRPNAGACLGFGG